MTCTRYATECKRNCQGKCAAENSYYPSNGSEGISFIDEFCSNCIHDNPDPEKKPKCEILTATMCFSPNEPGYPLEWQYDALGHPTCTKYVPWNWNRDGDPDDPDNPNKPPDPPDPNQLHLFPLWPDETTYQAKACAQVMHK